jgi:hypothetical protein
MASTVALTVVRSPSMVFDWADTMGVAKRGSAHARAATVIRDIDTPV